MQEMLVPAGMLFLLMVVVTKVSEKYQPFAALIGLSLIASYVSLPLGLAPLGLLALAFAWKYSQKLAHRKKLLG